MRGALSCWVLVALAVGCGGRPLPSSYVERTTLGANTDRRLDAERHSFDPSRRNTLAFANDLLARAEEALTQGDTVTAITRAQDAAGAAGYALAARPARERVRARAWELEARAWRARGYPGRALVAEALSGLASDYLASDRVAADEASFAQTLRDLEAQVEAANRAEAQARSAALNAVLGAVLATANAVASQVRAQQAISGQQSMQMQQATQALAQRALATSVQAVASAAAATSESAALVSRMDAALQRTTADASRVLSLQTPEVATARTPLSQIARFYLEAAHGDPRYLQNLARRLARTSEFRPAGIRQAIELLAATCSDAPAADALPSSIPRIIEGVLDESDGRLSSGEYREDHVIELEAGQTVRIDLESNDFDAWLIVRAPNGEQQSNDDRGDGTLHSALTLTATEAGSYVVTVTTYGVGERGAYVLRIGSGGSEDVARLGCAWSDDANRALNLVWLLAMRETRRLR